MSPQKEIKAIVRAFKSMRDVERALDRLEALERKHARDEKIARLIDSAYAVLDGLGVTVAYD